MNRYARATALAFGGIAAIAAVAGPRIDVDRRGPHASYPVARANPPSGGGGNDPETMKKLCGLLGVGGAVIEEAPKACGVKTPGELTPTAVVCSTAKGDSLAKEGFRVCETCVPQQEKPSCEKEVKVKAKINAHFRVVVYGFTVECKAGATYEASASSTVSFQNTTWNPTTGTGTDGPVTYFSNILTVAASTKAQVQLGGDCTVTPPIGNGGGGGGADLDISCEVTTKGNVFALTATREGLTCPKGVKDASVSVEEASTTVGDGGASPTDAAADAVTADAMTVKAMGM